MVDRRKEEGSLFKVEILPHSADELMVESSIHLFTLAKEHSMAGNVMDHCKSKGISLLELADQSGLDLKRVQAIYLGRWTPSPVEREKLAAVLEVPIDEVAWGHKTPIQHIYGEGPS
jgi:cyanate lyase